MFARFTLPKLVVASLGLLLVLMAVGFATRRDPDDQPYLKVLGGGFNFNYRVAEVYYGFTAAVIRPLPTGSIIEAEFEDPGGGPSLLVSERVGTGTSRYMLRSPPVRGVKADTDYHVDIRVKSREGDRLIWQDRLAFRSQIADDVVPDKPLTIGPGYQRPPDQATPG